MDRYHDNLVDTALVEGQRQELWPFVERNILRGVSRKERTSNILLGRFGGSGRVVCE
jgi:hypothetical protein